MTLLVIGCPDHRYTASLVREREEKRGEIRKTFAYVTSTRVSREFHMKWAAFFFIQISISQQTLVCLLGQSDKRFFQRSSTILALAHDALTERQGLPSYFVCFVVRARAVLGLG